MNEYDVSLWFQFRYESANAAHRLVTGDRRYFHVGGYLRSQSGPGTESSLHADLSPGSNVSFVTALSYVFV